MAFSIDELRTKRIGVLLGGLSAERDVSLRSGEAIAQALESRGFDVARIDVGRDVARRLLDERVEVAFIGLHGRYGEDGCIQGLLESMFVPYTGSGVLASAMAMDKVVTKRIFQLAEVPVADWMVVPRDQMPSAASLPFGVPCVVKPSREGSSVGVSLVEREEDLAAAVAEAARHPGEVLVERYVKGREINVAVLDGEALGAIEIRSSRAFYDYTAKYTAGMTQYVYPAPVTPEEDARLSELAVRAYAALGCQGAARVDFIAPPSGDPLCLEVNTLPGMTATSLLPKIAAGRGLDFPSLCERLLMGASLKA